MTHAYRPDIDGLRAVAVIAVIIFHIQATWLPGGFVGVDVFFVISGFLITSIITSKAEKGEFSIVEFWERRVRRIVPALVVVLFVTSIVCWFLLFPKDFKDFGESVLTTSFFSSNILFYTEAGYFAAPAELKPLLHTWSLAIEEQFYLVFPLLLVFILRKGRSAASLAVLIFGAMSLYLSQQWVISYPDAAFYLLPSRAWELLLGSLLALNTWVVNNRAVREIFSTVGIALISFAYLTFDSNVRFPGLAATIPCVGTAFMILGGSKGADTIVSKILSLRVIVFTGLLSYSLYLWHWPIIVLSNYHSSEEIGFSSATTIMLSCFILSYLSWKFVETPIRTGKILASRAQLFFAAACTSIIAASFGLYAHFSNGAPSRLDKDVLTAYNGFNYYNARRKECLSTENKNFDTEKICQVGEFGANKSVEFLVIGDSHANSLMPLIDELATEHKTSGLYAMYNGCPPLLGVYRFDTSDLHNCHAFNEYAIELAARKNISNILLLGRWAFYSDSQMIGSLNAEDKRPDDWLAKGQPALEESRTALRKGLQKTVQSIPANSNITLLKQVPLQDEHISPRYIASRVMLGSDTRLLGVNLEKHHLRQQFANSVIDALEPSKDSTLTVLDPSALLCNKERDGEIYCPVVRDGGAVYRDDDHLSTYGSKALVPLIDSWLESFR